MDCGVCLERMRLPYVLNCGHSLCVICTEKYAYHKDYNCAFCRSKITLISPNYALRESLDDSSVDISESEKNLINRISDVCHNATSVANKDKSAGYGSMILPTTIMRDEQDDCINYFVSSIICSTIGVTMGMFAPSIIKYFIAGNFTLPQF
jgi:hypothetical protein